MTNNIVAGSVVTVRAEKAITPRLRSVLGKQLIVDRESPTGGAVAIKGLAGGWVSKSRLDLVPKADEIKVGTYIISLQQADGTLLPASEPKKYGTDAQAKKIAELMAAKHGGKFVIFKAIGEYEMPVAVKPTFRSL